MSRVKSWKKKKIRLERAYNNPEDLDNYYDYIEQDRVRHIIRNSMEERQRRKCNKD